MRATISITKDCNMGSMDGGVCTACLERHRTVWIVMLGTIRFVLCRQCLESFNRLVGLELKDKP